MAYGFFGAFILGFLGTALPRMMSAPPFGVRNVTALLAVYGAMAVAFGAGKVLWGDGLLLLLLLMFLGMVIPRAARQKDTPPPGFVLVLLAWVCVIAGAVLAVAQTRFAWGWPHESAATFGQRLWRRTTIMEHCCGRPAYFFGR